MPGITQTDGGKFKFVIGEGISKAGAIPPAGSTNTRGFFEPTAKEFIKKRVMSLILRNDEVLRLNNAKIRDMSAARYVWLPVFFENGIPVIRWFDEWKWEDFD